MQTMGAHMGQAFPTVSGKGRDFYLGKLRGGWNRGVSEVEQSMATAVQFRAMCQFIAQG